MHYTIPQFTKNDTLCSLVYTLTYTDPKLDNTVINFDPNTSILSVDTSLSSKLGVYTLLISAYINSYPS